MRCLVKIYNTHRNTHRLNVNLQEDERPVTTIYSIINIRVKIPNENSIIKTPSAEEK